MAIHSQDTTPLILDQNGRTVEGGFRNMQSGSATVTTSGTPVQLTATSTEAKRLDISNPTSNSGALYIGGTAVSTTKGVPIQPGFTYTFTITDVSKVWVDADVNGSTVQYNYFW